jgi:limonene-1,2-epoxide hydrolase
MTYTPAEDLNIAVTREIVATGNAADWDACYALVDPDCVVHMRDGDLRGHAEMRAYDAKFFPLFSRSHRDILAIAADDETVVFRWKTDAVVASSGDEVVIEGCSWSRMKDGRAIESWIYTDGAKPKQQVRPPKEASLQ